MTPLIDLTFLLLIIFMITAPLLEYGVDVSPPEMDAEALPDEDSKIVNLNREGEIVFDKQVMSSEDLLSRLQAIRGMDPKTTILVRADGSRPYSEVMNVMKTVKNAGFTNISLITQAESDE